MARLGPKQPSRAPLTVSRALAAPVTALTCVVSTLLSLACLNARPQNFHDYKRWGFLPANAIFSGKYWALLSSTLLHADFLHLFFNVYWLWLLGGALEPLLGKLKHLKFAALLIGSAFVCSALELTVDGQTGIGLSGVVYAVFGFAWAMKKTQPKLATVIDKTTIQWMVAWLFVCVALTIAKVWNIANAAHFAGIALGFALGSAAAGTGTRRALATSGAALLAVAAIVSLFWAPWSPAWRAFKADRSAQQTLL